MNKELCFICDEPTGRAGITDDSLYFDVGDGPYCEDCWDDNRKFCFDCGAEYNKREEKCPECESYNFTYEEL
jgi:predicted amidophosphoribosyltransferase